MRWLALQWGCMIVVGGGVAVLAFTDNSLTGPEVVQFALAGVFFGFGLAFFLTGLITHTYDLLFLTIPRLTSRIGNHYQAKKRSIGPCRPGRLSGKPFEKTGRLRVGQ
jgi:hypothetical protein